MWELILKIYTVPWMKVMEQLLCYVLTMGTCFQLWCLSVHQGTYAALRVAGRERGWELLFEECRDI